MSVYMRLDHFCRPGPVGPRPISTPWAAWLVVALLGLSLSVVSLAGQAKADTNRQGLADALFGRKGEDSRATKTPIIARFESEDGASFILDRSQRSVLFRFETSHEVWVLTPRRAGRGDMIYMDDVGQPLLRATKLGGMTVFTAETPSGSAAALAGRAPPIRVLSPMSPSILLQRLALASAKASRATQKLISFDAEDVTDESASLFADSAMTAVEAFNLMARRAESRAMAVRIDRVLLVQGENSNAKRKGNQIIITIDPDDGLAGRPSSARIVKAISH
jgi:hypothetical protein